MITPIPFTVKSLACQPSECLQDDFDLDAPLPEVKAVISPVPELAEKTEKILGMI